MSRFSGWNRLLVFQIAFLACGATSLLAAERRAHRQRHQARAATPAAGRSQPTKETKPPAGRSQPTKRTKPPAGRSQPTKKTEPPARRSQPTKKTKPPARRSQPTKKTEPPARRSQPTKKTKPPARRSRTRERAKPQATEVDQPGPQNEPILPPSVAYKYAASREEVTLDFSNTGFQWPQPDGPGTAVTITYSFSNLLNGELRGLSADNAKRAVEEALTLWSEVAPIHFVEMADEGPLPTGEELAYRASDHPQIRFGHHLIDGETGGALAHAYLPFSTREGLAGDIHFDRDEPWNWDGGGLFLETALHEVGHALGLDHDVENDAIMNPIIQNRFGGLGTGYLLADDIAGIRNLYGYGTGSVAVLNAPVNTPPGEDPDGDSSDQQPPSEQESFGVLATLDSKSRTLSISGDHEANSIMVISLPWFVAVIGTDDTPVNSQSGSVFFFSSRGSITCDLGSGDDTLTCFRLKSRTLECELGAGDDTLSLLFCSIRNMLANGATGTDALFRLGSQIRNFGHVGFEQVK